MPKRQFFKFEFELIGGLNACGQFWACDGEIESIEFGDGEIVEPMYGGRVIESAKSKLLLELSREVLARLRRRFRDEIEATAHTYDERSYEPIRIGHRGMATV